MLLVYPQCRFRAIMPVLSHTKMLDNDDEVVELMQQIIELAKRKKQTNKPFKQSFFF